VHSIPHIMVLCLGTLIFFLIHPLLALGYLFVGIASMAYFFRYICTRCAGHGSEGCPSGYGLVSGRLFIRDRSIPFRTAFKRNIWSVAIQWFLPLGAGIAFMIVDPDPILLVVMVVFCLVAFVWLPIASRSKGCEVCPQRKDCPWKGK
jgi:hypothetical protein